MSGPIEHYFSPAITVVTDDAGIRIQSIGWMDTYNGSAIVGRDEIIELDNDPQSGDSYHPSTTAACEWMDHFAHALALVLDLPDKEP